MAGRDFSAELFGGSEEKTQRGRDLSAELFGKPSKERTFGEALKDIGAGAVSGIGSLVQTPGQLYGLATGNFDKTGLLGAGQDIQKYGEEMKSAGLKAREQERAQKIAQAAEKGQFSAFGTALAETLKDPALLSTFLSEQLPQMVVPLGAGKIGTAIGAARGLGAEAAVGAGTRAAIGAGAIQQGADIGEGTYTQIYQELIDKGAKPEQAKTAALNLARASGASGAVISLLAQKLPGATRLEEALAGAERKGSRLATAGRAIAGEVPSEITEEVGGKLGQNIAMRQVKPEQSLTEGLGETAAMATLGAAGLGGAAGLAGRAPSAPVSTPVPPIDTTTPPDTGLQTKIEETTGISRTVPEITPLSAEEAGRQRILNLQKKVDADVAANEGRAAREGIPPVVPPTPARADVSKPGLNETQMPQATSREELEAKQAEIDKLRLAAGLPTGPSSKTPGIQPTVAEAVEQPRTQLVDNRPLNERAAQNRLLVMQNMLKNEGGDPASLTIVPHPTAEGKFAIQSEDKAVKLTPNLPATAITRPETPVVIDPVNAYIEVARRTNTPASIRLVRDFEAGIVTREDIQDAIDAEQKAGKPLPLTYLDDGSPGILSAPTYKPRGERFVPPIGTVTKPTVEEPPVEEPPEVEPPTPTAETPKTLEEFKQRLPVAFDNTKVRSANDVGNFYSLADELSKSANPVIRRIGELGKGVSSKIKLRKPTKRLMISGQNAAGVYRYDDDSIQMQTSHAGDEHTNAHETLHALIARAQRQPTERQKPTVQKIEVLFAHVKKELKRQGKGHYYGLTNVREFTAEAMSNPEFQYELMQISYGGRRSAWTEFTRLVAELLGITETNALTEVLNLVDKLAQTKQPRAVKTERGAVEFGEEAMQLPFTKKEAAPTPTGNGQASLNNLAAMGRAEAEPEEGYKAKISKAWKESSQNPKATAEEARSAFQRFRDRIETWAFSSDAALNNKIRRAVNAANIGQEEKIGLMLNTSLSQTVHSDAVASLFLQKGGITYDKSLHKWVGQDKDANFVTLSNQLDAIAAKNGLTKPQIELIAHAAFEAKRTQSLIRFNDELSAKIAAIKAEAASKRASSPVASSALSEKAERMKDDFKFIHLSDEQIATGMEFFKLHPELNEVVKTWNEIRDNAAKVMVESGLWSESDAEFLLSNADYVPFYREDQLEQGQGPKEFIRGLKVQAKERKLKGSSKPVNDIFNNQVRWVQYSINRAVRNRSAIALADTAVAVGAATKVESQKDGANVTRIWRDGNPEYYDMADPMFMEAFNGLEAVVIPSWKWASTLANALRQSVVMYPLFSVAQVPQDSFAAMFSSGLKPQYALRIPILAVKEFIQTLRGASRSHQELKNIGAVGVRDFTSAMVRQDAEIFAGLRAPPGFLGKLKYGLNHIAMAADNAVRQAVFEAAEAQGLSKAEAFEKSFEVFNVRRKGSSKTLALASQLIPFFNAYLAAQSVAYKTITGRGISPQERTNALQTFAATTASVMTMSLLYAMMNGDDDDYLDKPAIQRDRLLMIPGTGGMSIPLRSDLFTLPKIITEHMYLLMTDKGYEDGRKFRDSMVNALGNSLLGPTAVPQAIKPIVEVAINHDFFQGRPLIGTYQQKLETERQFTDSTSEFGKFIGSSGLISPIAVDHLTRGMFGSAGGLMLYMTSAMMDSNPDAPRPSVSMRDAVATLPGMSGFLSKSYDNALKRDFYILKEEVDKAANTYNDLKNRSPDEISKFLEDEKNVARIGLQKTTNKIAENLSKIRKNISYVTNSDMSADEKQDMLKDLRDTEKEMLKGVDVKQLRELGMV